MRKYFFQILFLIVLVQPHCFAQQSVGGFGGIGYQSSPSLMGTLRLRLSQVEIGLPTIGFADEGSAGILFRTSKGNRAILLGPIYHFTGAPGLYGGIAWVYTAARIELFSVVASNGIVRPGILLGFSL